jgi:MFS family permease
VAIAIVQPLLHRSIRRIWIGQVLAAMGTQLYSVALLWTAVGILGPDAGYLETLEAAAVPFGSLLGGALTDGWHPKVTLVAADLARGAVVLALPLGQALGRMSPELLVAVALSVGVMTGCFEPTLQAALTPLAPGAPPAACDERAVRCHPAPRAHRRTHAGVPRPSDRLDDGGLVLLACGLPLPWLMLVAAVTAITGVASLAGLAFVPPGERK